MRTRLIAPMLAMLLCLTAPAAAQVSVSIGINVPVYPRLVVVPGYPVYYAPQLGANYFFYDGMFWVYDEDNWYSSFWYNGPWSLVAPVAVPVFILRIPVRYYRAPPRYFRAWRPDAPPRWREHWGREWEQRRSGWDRWDRRSAPAPAPLPTYQRNYTGARYPHTEQQRHALVSEHYRYQPHDRVVRERFQQLPARAAPAPAERSRQPVAPPQQTRPQERSAAPPVERRAAPSAAPHQQRGPEVSREAPPQRERGRMERPAPHPAAPPHSGPPVERGQQTSRPDGPPHGPQGNRAPPEERRAAGKGKGRDREHE